tara:strand:- start:996 stop:1292 length:297 start_codon:yes stop_codon:yes gene_type:complete
MPSGMGTYGKKRGRPPKQSKKDRMDESKGMKGMKKGMKSKSRKGDKDFTTKKGDKDFHEKGKDVKKKRSPYQAFVSKHRKAGKTMKEIGAMWRKTKKK